VDTQVKEVLIPGLEGELGILPGHRSLVLALGEGRITFRQDGVEESIQVSGGYAEIQPGSVLVFSGQPEE
jgi:F-type H+-transporting ATPase subunit epsilon